MQCLVLVRDDFWMALSRFLRTLEIDLSSDRNMTAVDLFDRRHARGVLAAFGRGYGALPEDPEALTNEQKRFLDQAIDGLAGGRPGHLRPAGPVRRDVQGPAMDPVELEGSWGASRGSASPF